MPETIAIAADHAGFALKTALAADLAAMGHAVIDLGTHSEESVDYPDFGHAIAGAVASGRARFGIVVCGTGIGVDIAANRHPDIRSALCTSGLMARYAREHNDANVLALGSRIIGVEVARDCVRQFLSTQFAGGRHAARITKLALPSDASSFKDAAE